MNLSCTVDLKTASGFSSASSLIDTSTSTSNPSAIQLSIPKPKRKTYEFKREIAPTRTITEMKEMKVIYTTNLFVSKQKDKKQDKQEKKQEKPEKKQQTKPTSKTIKIAIPTKSVSTSKKSASIQPAQQEVKTKPSLSRKDTSSTSLTKTILTPQQPMSDEEDFEPVQPIIKKSKKQTDNQQKKKVDDERKKKHKVTAIKRKTGKLQQVLQLNCLRNLLVIASVIELTITL